MNDKKSLLRVLFSPGLWKYRICGCSNACMSFYVIFQISATQLDPGLTAQLLLLADSENEKNKWVNALTELQKILRRNLLPDKAVIRAKELFDAAMPLVKISHCAAVLGKPAFWFWIGIFFTKCENCNFTKLGLFLSLEFSISFLSGREWPKKCQISKGQINTISPSVFWNRPRAKQEGLANWIWPVGHLLRAPVQNKHSVP